MTFKKSRLSVYIEYNCVNFENRNPSKTFIPVSYFSHFYYTVGLWLDFFSFPSSMIYVTYKSEIGCFFFEIKGVNRLGCRHHLLIDLNFYLNPFFSGTFFHLRMHQEKIKTKNGAWNRFLILKKHTLCDSLLCVQPARKDIFN